MSETPPAEVNENQEPSRETIIDLYGIRKDRLIINSKELTDLHPFQQEFIDALNTDDGDKLDSAIQSVDGLFEHFSSILTETDNSKDLEKGEFTVATGELLVSENGFMQTEKIVVPSFELLTKIGGLDNLTGFYMYYLVKMHEGGHFLDGLTKTIGVDSNDSMILSELRQNYFSLQALKLIAQRTDIPVADVKKIESEITETQNFLIHVGVRGLEPNVQP